MFGKKNLENQIEALKQRDAQWAEWANWANARIQELESLQCPEAKELDSIKAAIASSNAMLESINASIGEANAKAAANAQRAQGQIAEYEATRESLKKDLADLQRKKTGLESEIVDLNLTVSSQEYGLYEPRYDFQNVERFKEELKSIRSKQKIVIKKCEQESRNTGWTVNGSKAEGQRMASNVMKSLMTGFNFSCDEIIRKIKVSNLEKSLETIEKQARKISKYGQVIGLSIPYEYIQLKKNEARISYEYAQFKEKEKERIRELKEQEREARKLAKEIADKRKKLEKERKQYQMELDAVLSQLEDADDEAKAALEAKKNELEGELGEIKKAKEDVDYREANQKAGYVYVISNIGAFGENVYKIGMTRRLDPMERVRELGDASVPFNFDVHALIFSDDAPALEAALHRRFEDRKLNLINQRREFFRCTLDEIKQAVHDNYDETVEFFDFPDAEQYRLSEAMRNKRAPR